MRSIAPECMNLQSGTTQAHAKQNKKHCLSSRLAADDDNNGEDDDDDYVGQAEGQKHANESHGPVPE